MSLIDSFVARQSANHQALTSLLYGNVFLVGVFYLAAFGAALAVVILLECGVVWLARRRGWSASAAAAKSDSKMWRRMNERYDRLTACGAKANGERLGRWVFLLVITVLLVVFRENGGYLAYVLPGLYLILFGWKAYFGTRHANYVRTVILFLAFLVTLTMQGWLAAVFAPAMFFILMSPLAEDEGEG